MLVRRHHAKNKNKNTTTTTNNNNNNRYSADTLAVGVARVGQRTQSVRSGRIRDLVDLDFGPPLHSVVIVGEMDEVEQKMLDHFAVPTR